MQHWKLIGLGLTAAATTMVSADIEFLKLDGYTQGDAVTYQPDFQPGEIAALRFVPEIECPCLVTDVSFILAGSQNPQNIGIKIWEDPAGEVEPGTLLIHDFATLTPSDTAIQTVDMRPSSVVVQGPFRVGLQHLSTGLPAVVTDTDGTMNTQANYVLKNMGTFDWAFSQSEDMTGDFVLRAAIDNAVLADVDNDGVLNESDNCIQLSNSDQRDTDNDSIGNFCDTDVAVPNDCIVNFLDFQVYAQNFEVVGDLDTDNNGDGVTNFFDLARFASYFLSSPGPSAQGCN